MDKAKPNAHNPDWLDNLIGPVYLDFIAPEPLEDAIRLLKDQQTEGFFRFEKMAVDLTPVDADTFRFKMTMRGYKKNTVEAKGLLKRWERTTTHCTARVSVAPQIYLIYAAVVVVMLATLLSVMRIPWVIMLYTLLFFGMVAMNAYFARRRVNQLADRIEAALHRDPLET
jgi:hypothetical protein